MRDFSRIVPVIEEESAEGSEEVGREAVTCRKSNDSVLSVFFWRVRVRTRLKLRVLMRTSRLLGVGGMVKVTTTSRGEVKLKGLFGTWMV